MYLTHWGLKEKPFENTPDPKFIYYSQEHKEALARLLYVVRERKGAALLTGEYGSGKTLLSRVLWHELQLENRYQSVFILNPRLYGQELVQEILYQLTGGEIPPNKIDLFHSLHRVLYTNNNTNKHTIIVIDEAQAIRDKEIFEELRLLLNFQLDNAFLLTIILLGQPELKDMIAGLPQFTQRMAVRFHLKALNEKEVSEYILHRLKMAGATKGIFTDDAVKEVYFCSNGIPRMVNNICDMALLVGFGSGVKNITKDAVVKVKEDMDVSESNMPIIEEGK